MPEPAVCRMLPQGWKVYRAIRLAMLEESPGAFGGTHDHAAKFDAQLWQQRLADNVVFLARVGQVPAGSVMYTLYGLTVPGDCTLGGMWVDPRFRGTGVGRALVDAVITQAAQEGKDRVLLHVVADNANACALYSRVGFVPTGSTVPYPHDDKLLEVEMEFVLPVSSAILPVDAAITGGDSVIIGGR